MVQRAIVIGNGLYLFDENGRMTYADGVEVDKVLTDAIESIQPELTLELARRLCDNAEVVGTHARVNLDDLNALREALDRLQTPIG